MNLVEPASRSAASCSLASCNPASTIIFIGRDSRGNWVAREQNGLHGGLFVNRAQAFKYALFENGHHPETIVELSREIELDPSGTQARSGSAPLFLSYEMPHRTLSHSYAGQA